MTAYSFSQLIDFTRTTSGTFVGSNGLIQTTPQSRNLLTWTQEFDNAAWIKSDATITANSTTAPDGTATADKLVEGATTNRKFIRQAATNGVVSVYAKKGERDFVTIGSSNGVGLWAVSQFNLNTGTYVGSYQAGTQPLPTNNVITPVGNGWYRVSCLTASSLLPAVIMVSNGGDPIFEGYTGNGTSGIFIWGAQLDASVLTDYTRNVGGLFPPRFDYDPVTLAPRGILIEEQRTNLLLWSEQFDNAAWTKQNNLTVTPNTTVAPDGATTADTITNGTGQNSSGIYQTPTLTNAVVYTISYYVRAGTTSTAVLGAFAGSFLSATARVISGPGSVSGTAIITLSGLSSTEWTRVSYTITGTGVVTSPYLYPETIGVATGKSVIVWGAQLEAGAFATSYIQTLGNPGGVTRAPDQASIVAPMFAPWYNESAGTLVFEGTSLTTSGFTWPAIASSGSAANAFGTYRSAAFVAGFIATSGTTQMEITSSPVVANVPYKLGIAAQANNGNFSFNGNIGTNDPAITMPVVNRLSMGANSAGNAEFLNGHIRRITYYPVRLSDLQLQALTA